MTIRAGKIWMLCRAVVTLSVGVAGSEYGLGIRELKAW